ncbi:MAG TPA: beta-ketoacyl synthase N-terminal-like domain-containing protein, partial [Clostridia bacterium]|nr:beta-ketoacyl synthase N-terminal-like domain-containing protein [Clostridia bacterium]
YSGNNVNRSDSQQVQTEVTLQQKQVHFEESPVEEDISRGILEPIAVIGISGRFPQSWSVEEFWNNIKDGKECITEIPSDRWDWREHCQNSGNAAGKCKPRWGGFLPGVDQFDPLFFEISPKEAEYMDPRQRLFLEEAWHALEDAGYMGKRIRGKSCGVYVGVEEGEYGFLAGEDGPLNSNQNATLSARIAYALDLKGPNLALTAACSSGLVAVHQACQALRQGDCEMALTGGINLIISPLIYKGMGKSDMLSPDGKCYVFDERANGLVPGEAVAVVLLKPLSKAVADKDRIYGCIKASGVNYNGQANGITAPNSVAQAELIKNVYDRCHINPEEIQYVMAHSVGSKLGDPVEVQALTSAFGKYTGKKQYCAIGTVKPLIGHTFAASGVVSLIGMLMAMKDKTIPALYNYEHGNTFINFEESPFTVNKENIPWVTADNRPRLGAISTTGISGTNAHAVIEEYIPSVKATEYSFQDSSQQIMVFSAANDERLAAVVQQMLDYMKHKASEGVSLRDIAYNLQTGREAMKKRMAFIASSKEEVCRKLEYLTSTTVEELSGNEVFISGEESQGISRTHIRGMKNINALIEDALREKNLECLALAWVEGNTVPWENLYADGKVKKISIPTYPFTRRKCWINTKQTGNALSTPENIMAAGRQDYENKAAEFYTYLVESSEREYHEEYLTFCPFEEKIPGFSVSRVHLNPEKYPSELARVREKQAEMRQVLFWKVDFCKINSLFDIGCGHGTDVIQIAKLYPHIMTHGFTITQAQADLGNQRIKELNLDTKARIFHRDSSKDEFMGNYDVIIGIEVCCHIRNKEGVFRNIASSLRKDGTVLMMDFITNLRGPIVDHNVEISIPTVQEWVNIFSRYSLVIDEIIDVSPQIANYLYDPEHKQNTEHLPQVVKDSIQNFVNCSVSLERGWISYCLFKLKKDTIRSESERLEYNTAKMSNKVRYPEALKEMLDKGHIPYPQKNKGVI